ncbi:MAG: tetratricopeptide repeat protein [Pseudomarimonas sp.]
MSSTPPFGKLALLFDELVALEPGQQSARLAQLVEEDAGLHAELASLLAVAAPAASFFSAIETQLQPLLAAELGQHWAEGKLLGAYRLLRRLDSGGMGSVFLAERADGRFERQVAVKLLNWDVDDAIQRQGFDDEQRMLAMLEHPGIARLLDAGVAPEGRPYLVMEYVQGERLDRWVQRTQPDLHSRLRVMAALSDAVHHAHRHQIVHRDLKPSNVLIDDAAHPRLIDFGIGRRLNRDADPVITQAHALTPAYAAPEQFSGAAVGTAADVYALGVMLFELCAGTRPDPGWLQQPDAQRLMPRLAVSAPALSRDLDAVVAKAMCFDPAERYASAAQLADDLRHLLAHEPVSARPDRTAYRARLWVRRHPWRASLAALVLLAVVAFLVHAHAQAVQIELERDRAQRVVELLVDVFTANDPAQATGRPVSARELLDRGVPRVRNQLAGDPAAQAELLNALGRTYTGLGEFDAAAPLFDEALALSAGDDLAASRRRAHTLLHRGDLGRLTGKLAAAEADLAAAMGLLQQGGAVDSSDLALAQSKLGRLLVMRGKLDAARTLLDAALASTRRLHGGDARRISERLNDRASVDFSAGDFASAGVILAEVVALRRSLLGSSERATGSVDLATALNNHGLVHMQLGKQALAQPLFEEALLMRRRLLPAQHPELAQTLSNLGLLRHSQGELEAAEAELREALAIRREAFASASHPLVAQAENNLAMVLHSRAAWDEAQTLLRGSLATLEASLGSTHPLVATAETNLGNLLLDRGDPAMALPRFERAVQLRESVLPEGHPYRAYSLIGLGLARLDLGQVAAAIEPIESGHHLRATLAPADPLRAEAELALAELRWHQGQHDAAKAAAAIAAEGLSGRAVPRPALRERLQRLRARWEVAPER